ncbi:MAG: hypothetical protein A2046_03445 [Bacteroidetes bacterium GWA2_30_7]|nr:MAG: hypothetical protein A2046_03445 [Bacteroidetes bacterium GWA2_30_7]
MSLFRKFKKVKIATKTPNHQISRFITIFRDDIDYLPIIFDEALCFSALVAKKRLFRQVYIMFQFLSFTLLFIY